MTLAPAQKRGKKYSPFADKQYINFVDRVQ